MYLVLLTMIAVSAGTSQHPSQGDLAGRATCPMKAQVGQLKAEAITIPPEPRAKKLSAGLRWIDRQGVRLAWANPPKAEPRDFLRKFKNAGFNVVLVSADPRWERKYYRGQLAAWARAAHEVDITYLTAGQYGSVHKDPYRRFRAMSGKKASRSCCPLDRKYIERHVFQRVRDVLEIASRPGHRIDGYHMDLEMYESDTSHYPGPCVCDECFRRYLQRFSKSPDKLYATIPPDRRGGWLKSNDLGEHYAAFFELSVQQLYETIEQEVHRVKPEFIFSYAPMFRWLPGITRGLGTARVPCLILSEKEYNRGISERSLKMKKLLGDRGFPGVYLPGLWLKKHLPKSVAWNAVLGLSRADGWWCWEARALWRSPGKDDPQARHGPYGRPEGTAADEYWFAIKSAHKRADALRRGRGSTQSIKASALPVPPAIDVSFRKGLVTIDGELDDPGWQNAVTVGPFVRRNNRPGAVRTTASITWDTEFVYFGFKCSQPPGAEPKVPYRGRDNANLWKCESVEIFIDVDLDRTTYDHLVATAAGDLLDRSKRLGLGEPTFGSAAWDSRARVGSKSTKHGWSLELAVPVASLGLDKLRAGARWGVNLYRNDRHNGQYLCWSPTFNGFHSPERFGVINFRR